MYSVHKLLRYYYTRLILSAEIPRCDSLLVPILLTLYNHLLILSDPIKSSVETQ